MVTRLRSDKGSFVRSPKNAFDSESQDCSRYNAFINTSLIGGAQYRVITPICARGNDAVTGGAGGSVSTLSVTDSVGGNPILFDSVLNWVFEANGETWSPGTLLAATSNSCIEAGTSYQHDTGGASVPGDAGSTVFENTMSRLWAPLTTGQLNAQIEVARAEDLGFGNAALPPASWTGFTPLTVVTCPV